MFYIYADGESIYDPTLESYQLFEPKLKLEFGKAGSLEFTIPHTNVYFNSLQQLKTVIIVTMDDEELFRGRVLSIENNIQNFKTIYCEGNLAYLVDSVQKAEKYKGKTRALFNKIITAHNSMVESYKRFTVGNVTIDNRDIVLTGKSDEDEGLNTDNFDYKQIAINSIADEWNNTFDYIQTCLVDYCGGYLVTRYENGVNYIDYLKNNTGSAEQRITFGENMLDLTEEVNADELFTVLIPLGDENLTVKDVNGGSVELVDSTAVSKYGRIVRTHVFSNVNEASTLLENARRYMEANMDFRTTITVKAIDMHLVDDAIDSIRIGNKVRVVAKPHDISKNLVCTEIEYDLANPENNTYTFGNPKQSLTQRYREDKRKQSDTYGNGSGGGVGSAIASAGNSGWHLVDEKTDKKIDDDLEEKIKEWIDIDPNNPDGIGSLGGLYEYVKGHERILNQVGISFDATQDNISLYALKTVTDQLTGKVSDYQAASTSAVKEINGTLTAIQSMVASYQSGTDKKIASWEVRASELGTEIRGIADKMIVEADLIQLGNSFTKDIEDAVTGIKTKIRKSVGINIDVENNTYNLKNMKQSLDEHGRLISSQGNTITSVVTDTESKLSLMSRTVEGASKEIAEIRIATTKNSSDILLKADKTTVDGNFEVINGTLTALEGDIENLKTNKITAKELESIIGIITNLGTQHLTASSIVSPSINISGGSDGGTYPVATQDFVSASINSIKNGGDLGLHYHELTENVQAGTVTLGKPTSSPSTFNIRATKTYKEGVAAAERSATVNNIVLDASQVQTDISFNETTKFLTFYRSGQAKNDDAVLYTKDPIQITVSASKAYTAGLTKGQEGQEAAIEAATNAVTVTLSGTPGSYNANNKTIPLTVTGTLSSGHNTATKSYNINCTDAFNAGRNDVNILLSGVTLVSETYNATATTSASAHTTTLKIRAMADNNAYVNKSFNTSATAWNKGNEEGYTTGWNAVTIDASKITGGTVTPYLAEHYSMVKVTAEAKNGKKTSQDIKVDALNHFNYGVRDGKQKAHNAIQLNAVTKRSAGGSTEYFDTSTHKTTVYLTSSAKSSDSDYSTWSISRNDSVETSTAAWDNGKTAGITEGKKQVSVTGLAVSTKSDMSSYWSNNAYYWSIPITPTLSNGVSQSDRNVTVNVTSAYNQGKTEGEKAAKNVSVTGLSVSNKTDAGTPYWSNNAYYWPIAFTPTLSNGVAQSDRNVTINVTSIYNAGKSQGTKDSAPTKVTGAQVADSFDSSSKTTNYNLVVTKKDGSTKSFNGVSLKTSQAYSSGRSSVDSVSSVSIDSSQDTSPYWEEKNGNRTLYWSLPLSIKLENSAVASKSLKLNCMIPYNMGKRDADDADDVDISSWWVDDISYNYYADKYEGHVYIYLSNGKGGRYSFMYP